SAWTCGVCAFQKGSGICRACKRGAEGPESNRGTHLSAGSTGRTQTCDGESERTVPECGRRKPWYRKHDLCSEAGRRICKRTGGIMPEGAWRMGEHRKRICDEALPLQPDQLGNASIYYKGRPQSPSV